MDADGKSALTVTLKYGPRGEDVITSLTRVSRPGYRVYVGNEDIPRVLGGLGINILSTSSGIMTGQNARKKGFGGESPLRRLLKEVGLDLENKLCHELENNLFPSLTRSRFRSVKERFRCRGRRGT